MPVVFRFSKQASVKQASVTLIMYLYKYIYKGHDHAHGSISHDDIKQFLAGRLLTASEAVWRIFLYELTRRRPAVTNIPVHLEDQAFVVFDSSDNKSKKNAADRISKLDRYFGRPEGAQFDGLRYVEYYEQFTVTVGTRKASSARNTDTWTDSIPIPQQGTVRKRSLQHICRIDTKRLQSGELWYLRLLLQHRAARSYEELKTVDNTTNHSFSECARALGLMKDRTEFEICMTEARDAVCTPHQLRFLFIILINEGAPASSMFQEHRIFLRSDYKLNKNMDDVSAETSKQRTSFSVRRNVDVSRSVHVDGS